MSITLRGKCSYCCPDGGAVFDLYSDTEKKCRNCGRVFPFRRVKATGKPTKSQQRVIDKIVGLFGGTPEISMIGRKVWISLVNRERNMWLGDSLFGTIGPKGAFQITLQRIGKGPVLTDDIGLDVYLRPPG